MMLHGLMCNGVLYAGELVLSTGDFMLYKVSYCSTGSLSALCRHVIALYRSLSAL
jgi:hypothetical protein